MKRLGTTICPISFKLPDEIMELQDPFLQNVYVERNEEGRSFDCNIWYDDGWVSSSVDFFLADSEITAAPSIEALVAERRGEAREKLKNAVVCLTRLLPPRPEPKITISTTFAGWMTGVSSYVTFSLGGSSSPIQASGLAGIHVARK